MNFYGIPLNLEDLEWWEDLIPCTPSWWPPEQRRRGAEAGFQQLVFTIGKPFASTNEKSNALIIAEERENEYDKENEYFYSDSRKRMRYIGY